MLRCFGGDMRVWVCFRMVLRIIRCVFGAMMVLLCLGLLINFLVSLIIKTNKDEGKLIEPQIRISIRNRKGQNRSNEIWPRVHKTPPHRTWDIK